MNVLVYRRHKTRRRWAFATGKVRVGPTCLPVLTGSEPIRTAMMLEFQLASAGGGFGVVQVDVRPAAFGEIIETMMRVDVAATRAAFAHAETYTWDEPEPDELKDGDYVPWPTRGRRTSR